ncbi:MAG: tetratricopeptide repeat protein [Bacteroidales bacterium]|jgi:TolA-binding protein|nr:tetratricopeptide repeat protein [Bacteroidales bacterium]
MKKYILILIPLMAISLLSCNSKSKQIKVITEAEKDVYNPNLKSIDIGDAEFLVGKYIEFADNYPDDELSPNYLFNAGEILMNINRGQQAVETFNRIIKNYEDFEKLPETYFLSGFTYENILFNIRQAERTYKTLMEQFPDHELAKEAKYCIDNIGKSPEELIQEFEQRAREDSLAAIIDAR